MFRRQARRGYGALPKKRKLFEFGGMAGRGVRLIIPVAIIGMLGTLALTGAMFMKYSHLVRDLPEIPREAAFLPPAMSTVYADDGQVIAEFYRERRIITPLSQMPPRLIQAFIAAEDDRFFEHGGIDLSGIGRAMIRNIAAGRVTQGGSTITQQVVKAVFDDPARSFRRKIREALLAMRLEARFSKDRILFYYLNQIYLGDGAYGVGAASQTYFDKPVQALDLSECALLAGLPPAPSAYSPTRNPEMAERRRLYVLRRMAEEGYIGRLQAETAAARKPALRPHGSEALNVAPWFAAHVREYVTERYGEAALYGGGLKIHTTLNVEAQRAARRQVVAGLRELEKRQGLEGPDAPVPEGALVCIEAGTGHVKALVGGRDFEVSQFNRALRARRQPGSAFKPILYAAALDHGYTPATLVSDTPYEYEDENGLWEPENYDEKFEGDILLRRALIHSRNIPAIRVLDDLGVGYAADYAHKLGITSRLDRNLSLALGSSGVSLMEMVTAFSVFANQGRLVQPVFIIRIADSRGGALPEMPIEPIRAMAADTAFIMTTMLRAVVEEGTGRRVRALGRPVAGKTGTTDDFKDAWFLGYTPDYVTGVWVGFDMMQSLGENETGSRAASPIWVEFMKILHKGLPIRDFRPPETVVEARIDKKTGYRVALRSGNSCLAWFKQGTAPVLRPAPAPAPEPIPEWAPGDRGPYRALVSREQFFKTGF